MTTEELNEIRNRLAHPLPLALDCVKLLEEVQRLQIEVKERREVMADIVRKLGHGRCGLGHDEVAPAVERLQQAVTQALMVSQRFGSIDGDHHKAWVIDQMVRELTGSDYVEFVTQAKAGGYDWDEGIAP